MVFPHITTAQIHLFDQLIPFSFVYYSNELGSFYMTQHQRPSFKCSSKLFKRKVASSTAQGTFKNVYMCNKSCSLKIK